MHYTFLRDLISSPWQIESQTFNAMYPVFTGILNGITFEQEPEAKNSIPYAVSAASMETISMEEEEEKGDMIFVLPVRNVLTKHDQYCGPVGTRTLAQRLRRSDTDKRVIGHILVFESGGGQSIAVPELAEAIQECEKPVLAFIDGMAASAAYYIASYTNEIIASRELDRVGCIGTMTEFQGRKKISEENNEGVVSVRVYATNSTEKNEEYEEAINNGNVTLVQEQVLNPLNEIFLADVRANRPTVKDNHLKGRTFPASEVVGTLIDSIGTFDDAVSRLLELAEYNSEETNQSNLNSNSNKPEQTMNPKLSALVALLAVSNIEIVDGHATLSEEQLETISASLEKDTEMETQLQAATDAQATAETELATANETIATRDATITANETTIAGLKDEPGTSGAQATTDTDDKPNKNTVKTIAKGENLMEDISNVAKELLGEEL